MSSSAGRSALSSSGRMPRALARRIAHAHAGHDQSGPDAGREVVGLLLEQPHHLGSHGPAAEHDDGQLLGGRCHDGTPWAVRDGSTAGMHGWTRPRFSHGRGPTDAPMSARRPSALPLVGRSRRPGRPAQDGASASPASRANRSASVSRRSTIRSHAAAHRHHRRARHHVVVRGHGPAVGARGGDGQQVAALEVGGQPRVAHHDVPGLAVLADHAGQHRAGPRRRARPARRCSPRRRGRCGCCRSCRRRPMT